MPYNLAIPGQVSEHQLKAIEAVASLVPAGGKVVEIGSLFGRSSWAWAKSVDPSVTVYCIDPWQKNEGVRSMEARYGITYGIDQFKAYTADCPNVRALPGYSPNNFLDWAEPIDLYYEDAVHTDPVLARNLDFWCERIKPAGVICGDDHRPRFPDVVAGAERLARRLGREVLRVDFFWCLLPDEKSLPGARAIAGRLRELGADCDARKRARGPVFYVGPRKPIEPIAEGTSPVVACRLSNESIDPWPPDPPGRIAAGVRVTSEAEPAIVVTEMLSTLSVEQLPPDIPFDFHLTLPTGGLPAGRYRAIFDLTGDGRSWVTKPDPQRASGAIIEVITRT